jgi:hypothetical protein
MSRICTICHRPRLREITHELMDPSGLGSSSASLRSIATSTTTSESGFES